MHERTHNEKNGKKGVFAEWKKRKHGLREKKKTEIDIQAQKENSKTDNVRIEVGSRRGSTRSTIQSDIALFLVQLDKSNLENAQPTHFHSIPSIIFLFWRQKPFVNNGRATRSG